MEIDEESFTDTAAAIWMFNPAARESYSTASQLRMWMVEETEKSGPYVSGWATLGFCVSIHEYEKHKSAKAAVEGWFVLRLRAKDKQR